MMQSDQARVAELVHEMRNQLAVAKANLEAFMDGKLAPTPERLDSVLQTLHHLDELIKDLRVLRLESGAETTLAEINVCTLLQREFRAVEAVAASKNITMSVFRCPHPNAACQRFYGDPVRIAQIVTNVLLNAVRYTPAGGTIAVDCARRADELQITISDSGPGVTPAEERLVFEPGYRGQASGGGGAGRTPEGSGLGLTIVQRLVEDHGGAVSLHASSPHGATFVVRLPGTLPNSNM